MQPTGHTPWGQRPSAPGPPPYLQGPGHGGRPRTRGRRGRAGRRLAVLAALVILLGGAVVVGGSFALGALRSDGAAPSSGSAVGSTADSPARGGPNRAPVQPAAEIAARGRQSAVLLLVRSPRGVSSGTGVVLDDGRILTSAQVVNAALLVLAADHRGEMWEAEVSVLDHRRDVALLKTSARDLTPARLGDSAQLQAGEEVVAVGYPRLETFQDVAPLSVVGRVTRPLVRNPDDNMEYVETSAPIDVGQSGGPLFNLRGEVVGLGVVLPPGRTSPPLQNGTLAIPVDELKQALPQLTATQAVPRAPSPTALLIAGDPIDPIEIYYRLVNTRDFRRAYELFTPAFQRQYPFAEFESWFKDRQGIWAERIEYERTGRNAAVVFARVVSVERRSGKAVSAQFREQWEVVRQADDWRIEDLIRTEALPTSTPGPAAPPSPGGNAPTALASTPRPAGTGSQAPTGSRSPALTPSPSVTAGPAGTPSPGR